MILFLHGEDTYRLQEKLRLIRERFLGSPNARFNLREFDAESSADVAEVMKFVKTAPFLSSRRLAILKNFLRSGNKVVRSQLEELLGQKQVPEATIMIFYETGAADRRTVLYRLLNKPKIAEEFAPLSDSRLRAWVESRFFSRKVRIEKTALDKLCAYVGSDLWQMNNEISKLINYREGGLVRDADVELLVRAKLDENVFRLVNAIAAHQTRAALEAVADQRTLGVDAVTLLSRMAYQFRNLIIIWELAREGYNPMEISAKAKLHPFVVKKAWAEVKKVTLIKLKRIYLDLLVFDYQLKTGKINAEIGLDKLIVSLCK